MGQNPVLKDSVFGLDSNQSGWAAPPTGTEANPFVANESMTVESTVTKTLFLFLILMTSAAFTWRIAEPNARGEVNAITWPLLVVSMIAGFVAVIVISRKPKLGKVLAPFYAVAEGVVVGAISALYSFQSNGIVVQAAIATAAIFLVMLSLYRFRIIQVTQRMRSIVIGLTAGIAVFYVFTLLLSFFTDNVPLINDAGPLGIAFSVFVIGIASFNLLLNFDFIEKGAAAKVDRDYEWVGAVGILVTVVWLYLEMLRLLSKLQRN